ncbi:MAG: hypothetical protein MN733_44220 [Nitrososphaera sp.]|nr:hypothetical protein [Nitrososphaera sp.]
MSTNVINFEDRKKKKAVGRRTDPDSDAGYQKSEHAIIALMLHRDRSWNYVIDQELRDKPLDALGLLLLAAFDIAQKQLR